LEILEDPAMVGQQTPNRSHSLVELDAVHRYCRREEIRLLVLFGSRALETAAPGSDVDLALQMQRGREADKLRLIFDLEGLFAPHRVDLVILTPLTPPLLLHEIFSKGRPLYEDAPGEFGKARLRAWKLYQDTVPLRRLQKRALEDFVRRLRHVP
jgi:uncharacterized protein